MIRNTWVCVTLITLVGFESVIRAEEMKQMPPETCQLFAKHLSELFEKQHAERQVKFEVDLTKAVGLHADQDGIIAVPIKGLKEDNVDPAVESENGAGLCYLFLSPCYSPMIDGKPIDAKKLRRVKFNHGDSDEREAICLIVSVKHIGGDDWRLYAFGAEKAPIIDSHFAESTEKVDNAMAMRVTGAKDKKADLAFTLLKRYSASFAIAHK